MSSPSGSKMSLAGGYTVGIAQPSDKRRPDGPVRFELSEQTRQAIDVIILRRPTKGPGSSCSRVVRGANTSMTTRQYARSGSGSVGLDPKLLGPIRCDAQKLQLIYRRTGNLRAVQLLLGIHQDRKHGSGTSHRGSTMHFSNSGTSRCSRSTRAERTCSARSDVSRIGPDRQLYNAISMIYAFAVLFRLARHLRISSLLYRGRPR